MSYLVYTENFPKLDKKWFFKKLLKDELALLYVVIDDGFYEQIIEDENVYIAYLSPDNVECPEYPNEDCYKFTCLDRLPFNFINVPFVVNPFVDKSDDFKSYISKIISNDFFLYKILTDSGHIDEKKYTCLEVGDVFGNCYEHACDDPSGLNMPCPYTDLDNYTICCIDDYGDEPYNNFLICSKFSGNPDFPWYEGKIGYYFEYVDYSSNEIFSINTPLTIICIIDKSNNNVIYCYSYLTFYYSNSFNKRYSYREGTTTLLIGDNTAGDVICIGSCDVVLEEVDLPSEFVGCIPYPVFHVSANYLHNEEHMWFGEEHYYTLYRSGTDITECYISFKEDNYNSSYTPEYHDYPDITRYCAAYKEVHDDNSWVEDQIDASWGFMFSYWVGGLIRRICIE